MSRDHNIGRGHKIKIDSSSFERVKQLKYFGTTQTTQNFIREEMKGRIKSGNTCCHSVQNLSPSSFLSKNIKILRYTEL